MNLAQLQSLVCIAPLQSDTSIFTMAKLEIEQRVKSVLGQPLDINVQWKMHLNAINTHQYKNSVVLISLMSEVMPNVDDSFSHIESKWKEWLLKIDPEARTRIYFLTIFQHVNADFKQRHPQLARKMARRTRRINLMIFNLSQELGVGVIDLDQILSKIGAKLIEGDFQLKGPFAPAIAADMIASTMVQETLLEWDSDVESTASNMATDPHLVLSRALSNINLVSARDVKNHFLFQL